MDLEKILEDIIKKKYEDLHPPDVGNKKFSKIKDFEANAIGQIGETFAKEVLSKFAQSIVEEGIIHTQYDIKAKNSQGTDILFEVKTARKGKKNNTFQFNGLNHYYSYDYLLCIGICEDNIKFRIFSKASIKYHHTDRNYYIEEGSQFKKQLVKMNPNNTTNLKLTLKFEDLKDINDIESELTNIFS